MKRSDKKSSYTIIKRLAKLLRKDIFILALALLFAAVSIIASLYVNVAVGKAVDCMVSKDNVDFAGVGKQVSVILVCVLLAALFNYVMTVMLSKVAYKTVKVLRNKVFAKLQKVPVSYIDRRTPGEMISRLINDIEHVSDGLILSFGQLFSGIVTIVTTLVFMFILDYNITFIVVLATPLTLLAAKFIADSTYRYFVIRSKDNGTLSSVAEEAISGISVLKAFDMEEMKRKELSELGAKLRSSQTKAVFFSSTVMPTTRIINGIIYASIGVFGALTVINGKGLPGGLTIGLLSSFLAYATKFSTPFNEISGVFAEFQGAVAGAGRVFEVLDAEEESERPGAVTSLKAKGSVKIDNVYFSYDPERPLIEGFDLDVREGMRVAVVGPTGCGKTTFINLLMRFYDVDSGSISIDGNDVRNVARDTVHSNYGMVLQETWLKQGTV
ncbi:MAG: ABC transporter ATP-binding protein, partial [Clostridia bacterium]|nr:ABC transporter ATP-binding protein [Clostridia bacterium]